MKFFLADLWEQLKGSLFLHALIGSSFAALWETGLSWPQRLFRAVLGTVIAGYSAWALAAVLSLHVAVAAGLSFWGGLLGIKLAPVIETSVKMMIEGVFEVVPEAVRSWLKRGEK